MPYDATITTHGDPGDTYRVTGVDVAKSLADYGIPVTRGGDPAVAVLVSAETQAARIKFGTANGTGHSIATAGSYFGCGPQVVKNLKIGNAATGSAAALEITVFF